MSAEDFVMAWAESLLQETDLETLELHDADWAIELYSDLETAHRLLPRKHRAKRRRLSAAGMRVKTWIDRIT